jgi:hypothetical protein
MKKQRLTGLAFLLTLTAALPYSAGAAGNACTFCDAIYAECRAAGNDRPTCWLEYLECTYAFDCVIP